VRAAAIYRCGADKGIALVFAPDRLIGRLGMNDPHPIPDQHRSDKSLRSIRDDGGGLPGLLKRSTG